MVTSALLVKQQTIVGQTADALAWIKRGKNCTSCQYMFHTMTYSEMKEKNKPKLNSAVKLEFITDGMTNSYESDFSDMISVDINECNLKF